MIIILFFFCFVVKFSLNSSVIDLPVCCTNDNCIENSECVNEHCECIDGYVYSGDRTRCLKVISSYNDVCEESQQCSKFLLSGGICSNGTCVCKLGYHYLHGRCSKSSRLNEKCSSDNNCYTDFDIAAAKCENGFCKCSGKYYQREYRSCRRRAQEEGDECEINLDCAFDGNKNYTCDKKKICVLSSTNNNSSTNSIDKKLSSLSSNTCQFNGESICPRAQFYSPDSNKCVPEIGEPCEITEKPEIKNSVCLNNTWQCKNAFVPTLNNRLCKKVTTEYGKSCTINEQCYIFGPDALCKNKRCFCNENSHFVKSELFCWVNKQLGESCNDDKDCFGEGSELNYQCINKICACRNGTHMNSAKNCIEDVKAIGDSCSENMDCQSLENTSCTNNTCLCMDNYFEKLGKCVPGIKTQCNETINCEALNSHCKNNLCVCNDKHVEESSGLCVPISDFEKDCKYHIQCSAALSNSLCQFINANSMHGTCSCLPNYHYNYGQCRKRKVLDQPCDNIAECYVKSPHSSVVCSNGVCRCHPSTKKLNATYCSNRSEKILSSTWILLTFTILKLLV